jgi:hypothetical protein
VHKKIELVDKKENRTFEKKEPSDKKIELSEKKIDRFQPTIKMNTVK